MIVISVAVVVIVFVAVVLVAAVSAVDSAYVATDGWLAVEYFRIVSTSSSVGFYKGPRLTRTTVSTTTTSTILCIYTVASFKFVWPVNVRSFFKKILLELLYQVIGG